MAVEEPGLDVLWQLFALDSPSGDEAVLADWLESHLRSAGLSIACERLGDSLLATRGDEPRVAVFAHLDTTGFTLGYDRCLIPIGGPAPRPCEPLRALGLPAAGHDLTRQPPGEWTLTGPDPAPPGSRWVYANAPERRGEEIIGPYLDNRAGVWAALHVLRSQPSVAVAFTAGEELSGHGARVCARRLYERWGIRQALISDLTWHTPHVRCGEGVAISLRDGAVPRRRFLDRVLQLAWGSGIRHQCEIQSQGGSDGAAIERGDVPVSWAFVGAPEKHPHSAREKVHLGDLRAMALMLAALVDGLHRDPVE